MPFKCGYGRATELNNFEKHRLCHTHYLRPVRVPPKQRRKEMFYLTTHSTHCIYGYMASDIKGHSDSEK